MPIHGSLFQDFKETEAADPFALQNKKLLKIQTSDVAQPVAAPASVPA